MLPSPVITRLVKPVPAPVFTDATTFAANNRSVAPVVTTAPVVLVAYGAAGAVAIRAANTATGVSAVVTVGTPWAPIAVTALQSGLGGDVARGAPRKPCWVEGTVRDTDGSPVARAKIEV